MGNLLVVEDETPMRRIVAANLLQAGHVLTEAANVAEAKRALLLGRFDAVLVDQRMPDGDGVEVLAFARDADAAVSVVMITAYATVELAVKVMREGAFDFLMKPFEPDLLLAVAHRACERTALVRENSRLQREVSELAGTGEIYGESPAIRIVRDTINRVAPTNAAVLITGETGTGKELVARAIHRKGPRAARPFVAVNCAAFTETLLESELFGHEKGAFTGAERSRPGLLEAAHGGSLFLDEIGEMSPAAQAKLLRVLSDGRVLRVGSTQPRLVDVRVIAATHRDLPALARQGLFREDLYYRLAVIPIHIPPLRERREDIPVLCDLISAQVARELKVPLRRISSEALQACKNYDFPGNVRELRNLIERTYILSRGDDELQAGDFGVSGRQPPEGADAGALHACSDCPLATPLPGNYTLTDFLEVVERTFIERALAASGGVQAEAARRLGLSRSVLSYKLAKYQARSPGEKSDAASAARTERP